MNPSLKTAQAGVNYLKVIEAGLRDDEREGIAAFKQRIETLAPEAKAWIKDNLLFDTTPDGLPAFVALPVTQSRAYQRYGPGPMKHFSAFYTTGTDTIVLGDPKLLRGPSGRTIDMKGLRESVVVHEMVHWFQDHNGILEEGSHHPLGTVVVELEAYKAQNKWFQEQGFGELYAKQEFNNITTSLIMQELFGG